MSNENKNFLFRVCRGWNPTQLCRQFKINHYKGSRHQTTRVMESKMVCRPQKMRFSANRPQNHETWRFLAIRTMDYNLWKWRLWVPMVYPGKSLTKYHFCSASTLPKRNSKSFHKEFSKRILNCYDFSGLNTRCSFECMGSCVSSHFHYISLL